MIRYLRKIIPSIFLLSVLPFVIIPLSFVIILPFKMEKLFPGRRSPVPLPPRSPTRDQSTKSRDSAPSGIASSKPKDDHQIWLTDEMIEVAPFMYKAFHQLDLDQSIPECPHPKSVDLSIRSVAELVWHPIKIQLVALTDPDKAKNIITEWLHNNVVEKFAHKLYDMARASGNFSK